MQERLTLSEEIHAAGLDEMSLNVIASPIQDIRSVFDLMPTDTAEHWAVIATRMSKVPRALEQYVESLTAAAARGNVSPATPGRGVHRPVRGVHRRRRLLRHARPGSAGPVARSWTPPPPPPSPTAVSAASDAYAALGQTLRREILPQAPESDACGRERYQLVSRSFLGTARRPRGDLRLGPGRAGPDHRRDGGRGRADQARRHRHGGDRDARRRPGLPAARHRRAAGVDAGQGRRGHRQPGRLPLRHPRAGPHDRVHDRPDHLGRHLLHRTQRGLQPSRPDVVVRAQGRHRVRHLARADHRLPRGRPGPPPPGRPDGLPLRAAQPLAPPRVAGSPATARAGRSTPSG